MVIFVPGADQHGPSYSGFQFQAVAQDGTPSSNQGTVTIDITEDNSKPVAVDINCPYAIACPLCREGIPVLVTLPAQAAEAQIESLPNLGKLHQANADGSAGAAITSVPMVVTNLEHKVVLMVTEHTDTRIKFKYTLNDGGFGIN